VRLPPPPQLLSGTWVALLGWLVPGLGQMVTGRVGAGLALLVVLGGLFAGGLALTDFSAVDPKSYKLEFIAQALIGGPTALALRFTEDVRLERLPPWREVGSLYVVVAGFLNLIAICGATSDAQRRNVAARARRAAAVLAALELACARSLAQRPAWVPAPAPSEPFRPAARGRRCAPTASSAPPVALDPAGPP
jgi:TM2 domain-containing membrane protein YozV